MTCCERREEVDLALSVGTHRAVERVGKAAAEQAASQRDRAHQPAWSLSAIGGRLLTAGDKPPHFERAAASASPLQSQEEELLP